MGPFRVARLPKDGQSLSVTLDFPITGFADGMKNEREHMRAWTKKIVRFLQAEDGPTAVEYAVMLALIIVVCITAITTLGTNANSTFSNVALNTAVTGS